jgi:hypothetical protein
MACSAHGATQAEKLDPKLAEAVSKYAFTKMADGTEYVNLDKAVRALLKDQFVLKDDRGGEKPNPQIVELAVALAERVPEGGAIYLGGLPTERGAMDFRRVKRGVAISGGGDLGVILGGGQRDLQVILGPGVSIEPGVDGSKEPLRNLTMLFGNCTRITGGVADSSFVAAVNGWAAYAFKAAARVDNTLFLWFSVNWTFADYNAHLKNPDPEWWKKNCQCYFDLKGGGKNTRVYLMVETNYGNPGTGVWLENCDGLAMYHGATERSSAQGPGVYYLKNCRNVQVGLRRIFPGSAGGASAAMPTHAVTIEGGQGNTLHVFSDFAKSYQESIVNTDPKLQLWAASFDFETKGIDAADILRFCVTPLNNMPEGDKLKEAAALAEKNAEKWVNDRNKKSGQPVTQENIAALKDRIRAGRDAWWPINARHEETFLFTGKDLTKGIEGVKGKLPPPPSIPATDAPTNFRPLYFTWEPDFGKALLDAGADPTGKKPSDDAFAQAMFGMKADEVQRLYASVVKSQDRDAYAKLYPADPQNADKARPLRRPRLDVPAGTFLLTRPLVFGPGTGGMLGAGPDKTTLRVQSDSAGIKQIGMCGFANFTIQGGRKGIEITGADHNGPDGLLAKSYVAGRNYYNLTFRDQTFCGIHVGCNDVEVMGGAEHDQNKYVNLKFLNTGDYGIYMNHGMLDKWLLLNAEFVGQKKAGVSIKFNNLIHGGLFNCRFANIEGPGIDFMGGNPELRFRPYVVMLDQCEFIECGSATQPAVDFGAGELTAFLRTKIVTKGKKVPCGYIGSAQHMEDVTVDVDLTEGGKAVLLRGVRNGETARANGHILRGVKASGAVGWVNDANAQNELYRKTLQARKPDLVKADGSLDLNWDQNPAAHELAPPNGWVHPFVLYDCAFGDKTYAYTLLNADVDKGAVKQEVDLSPLAAR